MEGELPSHSLLRQPEIAKEIGFLIMYSANIEIWLSEIYKILLKREPGIAAITFGYIDNVRTKIDIVYKAFELKGGWPIADKLLPTHQKLLDSINFRNAIAHGQHGLGKSGKPNLTSNFLSLKRGKPRTITITPELIRGHVENLRTITALMREAVGADLLLQHHGKIDGEISELPTTPSPSNAETIRHHTDHQFQPPHKLQSPFPE